MKWTLAVLLAVAVAVGIAADGQQGNLTGRKVTINMVNYGGMANSSGNTMQAVNVTVKDHGPGFIWFVYPSGVEVYYSGNYNAIASK